MTDISKTIAELNRGLAISSPFEGSLRVNKKSLGALLEHVEELVSSNTVDGTVHKYGMAGLEAAIKAKDAEIMRLKSALGRVKDHRHPDPQIALRNVRKLATDALNADNQRGEGDG